MKRILGFDPSALCLHSDRTLHMHEFSMCEGIVRAVAAEMSIHGAEPGSLRSARVVIGALHAIVPDNLKFAYEVLTKDTAAAGSTLDLVMLPMTAACRECGWKGELKPPPFQCASCGSCHVDVLGGRELYLDNLEIEQE